MDFNSKVFMVEQINELIEQARSVSAECVPKILAAMDEWWKDIRPEERCVIIRTCVVTKRNKVECISGPSFSVKAKILKWAGIRGRYGRIATLDDLLSEYRRMSVEFREGYVRELTPKVAEFANVLESQCTYVNESISNKLMSLVMGQLAK